MYQYIKKPLLLAIAILLVHAAVAQTANKYQLPAYKKFQLANGLTVYLMEKHTVPVISISVIMPAGAINDGNSAGTASLTAKCLNCGTKSFTKEQIDQSFDFAGASYYTYATTEYASLYAKIAVKDEEKLMPIIKEMLVDPVFNDSDFIKEQKRTLVELEQAKESPGRVIGLYWNKFIYGNNAYGNVSTGTVSSVKALSKTDVGNFHKTYYTPQGSAIAVAGDFNTADMQKNIEALFGSWKKTNTTPTLPAAPAVNMNAAKVLLVNKDDARETTYIIGGKGIARNNPDYLTMQVVNTIFGGRFTSWLNEELRIRTGLTYGAGSYFSAGKNTGTFIISTHTANETTKAALDTTISVIKRLQTQPIDDTTLLSAKNYMIGLFPPRFQSVDQLSDLLTDMFWFGFDESYINNFEANVNAVTVAKAQDIIKKYFLKDNLQFVLIGKAADIKNIASQYGSFSEVQINDDIGDGVRNY